MSGAPPGEDLWWSAGGTRRHVYKWRWAHGQPAGWCGAKLVAQVQPGEVGADDRRHPLCSKCVRFRDAAARLP